MSRFDSIEAANTVVVAKRCELFSHNDWDRQLIEKAS